MGLLLSLNTDSDTPVNDSLHTEHLINLLDSKRGQDGFFANQQDCHEIMIILLGIINDIAETTRQLCYTFSPVVDDFGGEFQLNRI